MPYSLAIKFFVSHCMVSRSRCSCNCAPESARLSFEQEVTMGAKTSPTCSPAGTSVDQKIRLPEVIRLTGLARSSIYRLEQQQLFPTRVRLSVRAVGWNLSEVTAWLEARPRA